MPVPSAKSLVIVTASSVASLALLACSPASPADPRLGAPRVEITEVHADGAVQHRYTGVVAARVQSDLGFRVAGKVVQRLVDVGQHVQRGAALLRLDPADLNLLLAAQQQAVAAARATAVRAQADLDRLQGLVEKGAISAQTYDRARADAESARAQLAAAEAQAGVARNADDYALLSADADGVVVATLAEPGQVVAAGQTVVQLAHDGPREAAVALPEGVRPALGSDAEAQLYGDGAAPSFPASLRELSQAADPLTRTYAARYVLHGEAQHAPLGATVTIRLHLGDWGQVVVVPLSALYDPGQGPGVWLYDPPSSTVSFRHVAVRQIGIEQAWVADGLRPGDPIVALGAHLLHEGDHVKPATPRAQTDAPAGDPPLAPQNNSQNEPKTAAQATR